MNRTASNDHQSYFNPTRQYAQSREEGRESVTVNRHLRLRRLQGHVALGILAATALLVVVGMLLLILPAFKVRSIRVKGNERIATESVIAASGVSIGDEIVDLNKSAIADRLEQNEEIESVSVSTTLGGVTIRIVETQPSTLSNTGR